MFIPSVFLFVLICWTSSNTSKFELYSMDCSLWSTVRRSIVWVRT